MTKDDVPPLPNRIPHKRKHLKQALDVHLAMWASLLDITSGDYRRVQTERERRKKARPRIERIGILIGQEGVTPEQYGKLADMLTGQRGLMTEIWHSGVSRTVHSLCKSFGVRVEAHREKDKIRAGRNVIRNATRIFAFPPGEHGPVWDLIRYARHRNLTVDVIMPNGERR